MNFFNCYNVPHKELIKEGYEILGGENEKEYLVINVSKNKMLDLLLDFIHKMPLPAFFYLELPANKDEEERLRKSNTDPFHKMIYYLDNCSSDELTYVLLDYHELLFRGGIGRFGFGSHDGTIELGVTKYNMVYIYPDKINPILDFLEDHGINELEKYICAWDTFTDEEPGEASILTYNNQSIFDIPKKLEGWGMYLADIVEDNE